LNDRENSEYQGNGFGFPCIRRGQRRTTLGVNAYGSLTLYPYRNVFHGRIATKVEGVKAIKDVGMWVQLL